jgi:hypothetical protein
MVDSTESNGGWAQQWIEQQRALLDKLARSDSTGGASTGAEGMGNQWAELGKTYLAGLLQLAQGAGIATGVGDAGANFKPAGEMFDVWRSAWSNSLAQAVAPGGWSELLNGTPPLGLFREQTEAWRALAAAQADCQRLEQELAAVLRRVQADALTLLEERVKTRAATDAPVQGFRELYDLWVECSEQVFSSVAHSSAYCHLQAEFGNAGMRRRARIQKIIEQGFKQFDLPTRSEINSVHLQLRLLKQRIAAMEREAQNRSAGPAAPAAKPRSSAAKRRRVPPARSGRKRST